MKQFFRRKLIVVGGIKFRRKLIEMRTKKVWKSRQTFRSVGNHADGHVSDMREPSVMPSVFYVGTFVGNSADGHVSDMREPSVFYVETFVGNSADEHVSDMRATIRRWFRRYETSGKPSVNVAKSRKFFATLCEILTGYIPSVYPSVKR